jgi:hypothetical protein
VVRDGVQERELTEDDNDEEDDDDSDDEGGMTLWGIDIGDDELMAEAEEAALAHEYQLYGNDDSDMLMRDLCEDDEFPESYSRVDDDQLPFVYTSPAKRSKI